jgi:hypothetical protein
MHVIATGRSKTETAQTEVNGKKKVVKLGMKVAQRDGFEFEFTVVLDVTHDGHYPIASKDRTGVFLGEPRPISEQTGLDLKAWLNTGQDVAAGSADDGLNAALGSIKSALTIDDLKSHFFSASALFPGHLAALTIAKDARKKHFSDSQNPIKG